jgi:hypothetical protein
MARNEIKFHPMKGWVKPRNLQPIPVKMGTQPWLVYLHPEDKVEPRNTIRFKRHPWEPYKDWEHAYVHTVNEVRAFLELM